MSLFILGISKGGKNKMVVCGICNRTLNEDEIIESKFVCPKCLENLKERDWWNNEGRKKLLEVGKELVKYRNLAERREKFGKNWIELIKNEFGVEVFENLCKKYFEIYGEKGNEV